MNQIYLDSWAYKLSAAFGLLAFLNLFWKNCHQSKFGESPIFPKDGKWSIWAPFSKWKKNKTQTGVYENILKSYLLLKLGDPRDNEFLSKG